MRKLGHNLTGDVGKRNMELINIYDEMYIHRHYMALYNLLAEREPYQNISHKELPTFPDHVKFVDSKPYMCWYGIWNANAFVGAIYIGKENNIGLFIMKEFKGMGFGKQALHKTMDTHRLDYYLANISPHNSNSMAFFLNFGFKYFNSLVEMSEDYVTSDDKIIQHTYKFTPIINE